MPPQQNYLPIQWEAEELLFMIFEVHMSQVIAILDVSPRSCCILSFSYWRADPERKESLLVTRWSYSYCDGPLTVWDLEDDSWIWFLKLLSEGHPDPLPDPDPDI